MLFEQIATGGCQSYLIGCEATCAAVADRPGAPSQIDRYRALAAREGCGSTTSSTRTPTPIISRRRASSARQLDVPVVMHRVSPAPFADMRVDDGEMLIVGKLRLQRAAHARATRATRCACVLDDRVFTGDTLLIGGTGRTDLPTGDPDALYDSLFGKLLKLDPALKVYPGARLQGPQLSRRSAPR